MRLSGTRIVLYALAVLSALACVASADLVVTVETPREDLHVSRAGGFDVVRVRDGITTYTEGHPELPLRLVRFAVPHGEVAIRAEARVLSRSEIAGEFLVRPRQPEVPLSRPETAVWVEPEPAVYGSADVYPAEAVELLGSGNAGGRTVATVAFHPVRYVPAEGRLLLNETVEVVLVTERAPVTARMPGLRSAGTEAVAAQRVRSLVVNPEDVTERDVRGGRGEVDYLIVTSTAYEPIFQPLADWKAQKGLTTEIVTTSWIYANYTGVDSQEKIRNCIIDYYENKGTVWVLLGGDTGVVPARTVFAMDSAVGGPPDEDHIRCDLYYGDLDGTWDANQNGVYGQNAYDEVDMYADVFVGRAPVDNSTEATRFVNKTLTYEGAPGGDLLPTDYQEDMLFMAEVLWTDPWTDHAICKNMIDDESVPSQFDPITKLYQTSGNLSPSTAVAAMNDGYNIVNHNGHANTTVLSIGGGALYRSDFDGLTNGPRYGLFYSMGCWSAAIDKDCIAEHWNNSAGGGGAFYIGNSRYGWGSPGNPGYGTGDVFDREFFRKLFNEGLENAGVAHAAHKDAYVTAARGNGYYRYTLYELNLLGDPESRIWTRNPVGADIVHAASVPVGAQPFVVTVSRDGEPVEGAVVFLSGEEFALTEVTGPDGIATLHPAPSATGTLSLAVTGQGILPHTTTVEVLDQPLDTDAPAAVEELTLADPFDTGGVILLDWSDYAAPSDFAHYRVYRETERFWDTAGLTPVASGLLDETVKSWTDDTVENRVDYYYAVTAVDLAGNEESAVHSKGPIAASVNSRILVWDADDGDTPFDGTGDDFTAADGTEVPWVQALDGIGELYSVSETLPADLSPFELIIYLGGIISFGDPGANVPMTDADAEALATFVEEGGDVYVEEPMFGGTYFVNGSPATIDLWNLFHCTYVMGGAMADGNVQTVSGETGRLTQGMSFTYDYQSDPDHFVGVVGPDGSADASLLWTDQGADPRGTVYVDGATGSRRYMVPVLLGGMADGASPSTRAEYVTRILEDSDLIGTAGVGDLGRVNRLSQNSPNPFNPTTRIRYSVGRDGARVVLGVYDVAGRLVARLADGPAAAGDHAATWNGRDAAGRPVASGIYFVRLSVDGWSDARKMVLLK